MSNNAVATIEIGATTTRLQRALVNAKYAFHTFTAHAARRLRDLKFGKSSFGDIGKTAIGTFAGNMLSRGLAMFGDAARDTFELERALVRYQIATGAAASSTAALRQQVRSISRDTAIASDQVLAGSQQYVALTGDAAGAAAAMSSFARVAQASGASVADVANATASMKTSMGLEANDIEAAFSAMIIQGKEGAVEIKDLAGELANLAPQFAQFRGARGLGGIREMGAALQVVMKGAGSASEAATQLTSLMGALADPETIRKLGKVKINIFDKDPQTGLVTMRSASDIFEDIAKNQKLSDPRIVAAIFGRKEAQQAIRSIRTHIGLYSDLRESAKDTGAVQRDLNTYLQSDAGKIEAAFNNAKIAVAEVFTPERIEKFAKALGSAVDMLAKIVGYVERVGQFVDNVVNDAENRGAKQVDDIIAESRREAKRKGPEELKRTADALIQEAARIETEGAGEGAAGRVRSGFAERAREQGFKLRQEAEQAILEKNDPWNKAKAELAPELVDSSKPQLQRAAANMIAGRLEMAIRDAFADMKIEFGKKEVVTSYKNSGQHSRGPAR
jgi:TP901 family phage tail tape measure protein